MFKCKSLDATQFKDCEPMARAHFAQHSMHMIPHHLLSQVELRGNLPCSLTRARLAEPAAVLG